MARRLNSRSTGAGSKKKVAVKKSRAGKVSEERPGVEWFSRDEVAAFLDCTTKHVDEHYRRLLPETAVHRSGARVWLLGSALVNVKIDKALERVGGLEAEMLGGSSSPALEDFRRAKARLAELDLEERRKSLLPKELVQKVFTGFASVMRVCGAELERRFGTDVSDLYMESLDSASREVMVLFSAAPEDGSLKSEE